MDIRRPSRGFGDAFRKEFGLGRENWAEGRRRVRDAKGQAENAPRIMEMVQAHPGIIRANENIRAAKGIDNDTGDLVRADMGMGLEPKGNNRRAGQMMGAMAADLTQDTSRGFYWLLNALQASGAVLTETAYGLRRPDLFDVSPVLDAAGNKVSLNNKPLARNLGIIDENDQTRRGVRIKNDGDNAYYVQQNYAPGDVNSLLIPSGIAINTGLGLMTPFGGAEGYEAALPSQDDKTKTENVIGEVAMKYVMGRTGNMLPYDEFKKVRPDVSPAEYRAYKAFKYDKATDLNPFDDGQVGVMGGAFKASDDGIHGPEIQFLGRSLPVSTGVIPFASSVAGTAIGVGSKGSARKPIRGGLIGGLAGLAVGQVAGNLIEGERRRRNKAENESYGEL